MPDSVRQKHYDLRAGYMKDPRKRQMGSGRDLYALSEDNREIPVEIGLNPIIYNHEQCVLCSIVDITERKSKEDELKVLNESLKQSNKDLEEFTYIASHDLKEPLRGIHNYSMMLYEKYHSLLDEDGIKKLTTLPKLTQRLESQIDSLLSYSRVGKKGLELSPQKVHDLINNSKELINYQLESRCVKLDIAPDLPVVIGDKIRLTEVFSNLMSNAIKYNDNDIPEIKIGALKQSENDKQKGKVCIYVKDNGIGIKEEHLSKIFTIFKRLHPKTKYEGGTGVGLTIVKKIIEKHGGEITVESELGQGTTFYIALQAAENGIND